MKLKSLLLVSLAGLLVGAGAGCNMFGKSKKPKESPAIAAGVESDFRQRWIERRAAELSGQGSAAAAAREQAENEFREKYAYLKDEKK